MKHFFIPWVGNRYNEQKIKELVVGVVHGCKVDCVFHDKCSNPVTVREMDSRCPVYAEVENKKYYNLKNSNEIEIQSFIDSDANYPSYSAFSYYMFKQADRLPKAKRKELWERIAFTNLLQFYHQDLHALPDNWKIYDEAYPTLKEIIDDLTPHVIYAWNDRVKNCLKKHPEDLRYIGKANMQFGLSVYVFIPVGFGLKGKALSKLRYDRGIQSEKHKQGWYIKLVKTHLGRAIDESGEYPDTEKVVRKLANVFMSLVEDGLLGASENTLYFADNHQNVWTSLLKGLFLRALKDEFPMLGRYTNTGIEGIFKESIATCKNTPALLKDKEKRIAQRIANVLNMSKHKGKTFYKVFN